MIAAIKQEAFYSTTATIIPVLFFALVYQARFYDAGAREVEKTKLGPTALFRAAVCTCVLVVVAEVVALNALVVGHSSRLTVPLIAAALIVLAAAIIRQMLVAIAPKAGGLKIIVGLVVIAAATGIVIVFESVSILHAFISR